MIFQIKKLTAAYIIAMLMLLLTFSPSSTTPLPIEKTISRRQSIHSYTSGNITNKQLIEVLNAAYGMWDNHRAIPQISADYSLTIFAINATASYLYIPETDMLTLYNAAVNKEKYARMIPIGQATQARALACC